ncbi:MAG: hypothetical protein AAFY19_06045 [Pseudomonadota bacterium]
MFGQWMKVSYPGLRIWEIVRSTRELHCEPVRYCDNPWCRKTNSPAAPTRPSSQSSAATLGEGDAAKKIVAEVKKAA